MDKEEFLENRLSELNMSHIDEMGYGDIIRTINEYADLKALELKDHMNKMINGIKI